MLSSDFSSADDIQRNLLRVLAVTTGSWDLLRRSRTGRRLACRTPVYAARRPYAIAQPLHTTLLWAW